MRIAVDAGGTFTDVAVQTGDDTVLEAKAPTDHDDPTRGVLDAIGVAARLAGTTAEQLLRDAEFLIHGTTRSLNALITDSAAPTAFLTTRGHRDTLTLREGGRDDPFDHRTPFPKPFVPRRLTFEIHERIDASGRVVIPLDEHAAAATIAELGGLDVEAVAVSLLWAHLNPVHERRVGELVAEILPGVSCSLGHDVNPIVREFRRASSAVIDAALKPIMTPYLHSLEQRLREAGFAGDLLVATSIGGCAPAADIARKPILSLNSGPSMAPVLGAAVAARGDERGAVVVADTGGTTYDLSVVVDGHIPRADEATVAGHITGFGSVDVRGLGAGGGSIATVDDHGLLRVGPHSAGADPGPACYGAGGTLATLTDAALVTGRIDPDGFLGGRMTLDVEAAHAALAAVGDPLGFDPVQAAAAVLAVATETMATALLEVTIGRGIDPRESVLVAGGGAAGLNSVALAARCGFGSVVFPASGAVMSAAGALLAPVTAEHTVVGRTRTDAFDQSVIDGAFAHLDEWACGYREQMSQRTISVTYSVEARYVGQTWNINLPVDRGGLEGGDLGALVEDFHALHERLFAVADPGSPVEILAWRATACIKGSGGRLAPAPPGDLQRDGARKVYLHGSGWVEAQRWRGNVGASPVTITGPAVIDGDYSSILIDPGATARTTPEGSVVVSP